MGNKCYQKSGYYSLKFQLNLRGKAVWDLANKEGKSYVFKNAGKAAKPLNLLYISFSASH